MPTSSRTAVEESRTRRMSKEELIIKLKEEKKAKKNK
jgi:hypothetical protein